MTKKTRTILFFFFLVLFILAVPLIVFYSQGYRVDFTSPGGGIKIVQTGGVFIKAWPVSANINIDGESKKTDFLFGSAFWQNLLPKSYRVEVAKEGFQSWQKTLTISKKMVVEIKNINLFPVDLKFNELVGSALNFWTLPDGKRILIQKSDTINGLSNKIGAWRLVIYDTQRKSQALVLEESALAKTEKVEISYVAFSTDSKQVLLAIQFGEQTQNFTLDISQGNVVKPISLNFLGELAQNLSFNPQNSSKLFFRKNNSLYEGDLNEKTVSQIPVLKNVASYAIFEDKIYFLSDSNVLENSFNLQKGFVYKADFSGKIEAEISNEPILIKPETGYEITVFAQDVFLRENFQARLLNPLTKIFEQTLETDSELKISPDLKKIAYTKGDSLKIFFLMNSQDQPARKSGDEIFLGNFKNVKNFFWLNSEYLIIDTGGEIKIAEIDDRDKAQSWDIGSLIAEKMIFNETDKTIYALSKNKLLSSESFLK